MSALLYLKELNAYAKLAMLPVTVYLEIKFQICSIYVNYIQLASIYTSCM